MDEDLKIFIISPEAKVTYINKTTSEFWDNWKLFKECSKEEKEKINLSSYPNNCILFDRDLKNKTQEEIEEDYKGFAIMLKKRKINYFYSYNSPNGYHVIAPFKDLEIFEEDLRKELRKYYINLFLSDPAKISDRGVVSIPGRPHFKNNIIYNIKENFPGLNIFPNIAIENCINNLKKNEDLKNKILQDKDFSNYFTEDPFFIYIKNHIIPDGTNRDTIIFPNLAIAAIKSGLNKKEIDDILKPIIKNNFPGKSYNEFEGWYKKALKQEIKEYNPVLINNWMRDYSEMKIEVYNLKGESVKDSLKIIDIKSEEFKVYWDEDLKNLEDTKVEWLIDNWIPKGDICFVAGKAASYKTTICLHWAYAIANNLLVFNNYKTKQSKVLYLNEENSNSVIINIINRIRKGLEIENGSNKIGFSLLNNIRFDNFEDINKLIKFITENKIEVLFFDSFRRFFSGEENDATQMNNLFNILKYIRNKTKTTIILIHHYKKQDNKGLNDIRDRMRGSSDIINFADVVVEVDRKHGQSAFTIQHSKLRLAQEIIGKVIAIDEEDKNSAYFYEITDLQEKNKVSAKPEVLAEKIIAYLKENNISEIKGTEIRELLKEENHNNITRAIKILIDEEQLAPLTLSKKLQIYKFNKI
jgi:archaellum biogenesis ATPase FlaH